LQGGSQEFDEGAIRVVVFCMQCLIPSLLSQLLGFGGKKNGWVSFLKKKDPSNLGASVIDGGGPEDPPPCCILGNEATNFISRWTETLETRRLAQ